MPAPYRIGTGLVWKRPLRGKHQTQIAQIIPCGARFNRLAQGAKEGMGIAPGKISGRVEAQGPRLAETRAVGYRPCRRAIAVHAVASCAEHSYGSVSNALEHAQDKCLVAAAHPGTRNRTSQFTG